MLKKIALISCGVVTVLAGIALVLFFVLTGPEDLGEFPPRETSPYLLPWPAGIRYLCVQGVRGVVSHRGSSRFAYDFYMPEGSDICAARAGTVIRVVQEHTGHGYQWPNNLVLVKHEDGTVACYAHIRQGGSYVEEGQAVEQGQVLAASGNVGNSMMYHLHFHVTDPKTKSTIPVSFADVTRHQGVPRLFYWYAKP